MTGMDIVHSMDSHSHCCIACDVFFDKVCGVDCLCCCTLCNRQDTVVCCDCIKLTPDDEEEEEEEEDENMDWSD